MYIADQSMNSVNDDCRSYENHSFIGCELTDYMSKSIVPLLDSGPLAHKREGIPACEGLPLRHASYTFCLKFSKMLNLNF